MVCFVILRLPSQLLTRELLSMYLREIIWKIIGLDLNSGHHWISIINPGTNKILPHHYASKTQYDFQSHANDMILDNNGKRLEKKIKLTLLQEANSKLMTVTLSQNSNCEFSGGRRRDFLSYLYLTSMHRIGTARMNYKKTYHLDNLLLFPLLINFKNI